MYITESYTGMEVYVKRLSTEMVNVVHHVISTPISVVNITMPSYTTARYVGVILEGAPKLLVVCEIQVFPEGNMHRLYISVI